MNVYTLYSVPADIHVYVIIAGFVRTGAKRRFGQFFSGHLFALTLLRNETDSDDVILCLNSCKEKLDVVGMDEMTTGMASVQFHTCIQNTFKHHTMRSQRYSLEA